MSNIDSVIKNGLKHIVSEQQATGGFASLSSPNPANFSTAISYTTTFFTSTILACLNAVTEHGEHDPLVDTIRSQAALFLLGEKDKNWSFNYWVQHANERKIMPYPNDLDDTFGALAALIRYNHAIVDGEATAAIATMLTSAETKEGGPYRTWLVQTPNGPWADVDIVVNSTVGYFLSLMGIRLPNIESFVDEMVIRGAAASPYYPNVAPVLYFISRFYKNRSVKNAEATQMAIKAICDFRTSRNTYMTPVENAMTITSLINLNAKEKITGLGIEEILRVVAREGWKPYAFCIDPVREGKTSYAGASALTAALCTETLVLYKNAMEDKRLKSDDNDKAAKSDATHKKVIARVKNRVYRAEMPSELRSIVIQEIDATTDAKITTLAYEFRDALGARGKAINPKITDHLALGNLYGWIAYDVYDNILDGEGNPLLLPAAHFFLRSLSHIYETENTATPGCANLFSTIMDTIDNANTWEQKYCRLPCNEKEYLPAKLPPFDDYRNLADRSIGHAMGPLAELLAIGYAANTEEFQTVLALFRRYLIARQLHDDAHDWADDLLRGHVNSVSALVIKAFQNKYKDQERSRIVDTLPALREIFWKETITAVVALVHKNISAARDARKKSTLIGGTDFLEDALTSLEASAKRTLAERDDTLLFLAHYHPAV
jgi:hypothetical protein